MAISDIFSVWNVYKKALSNFPNTEQEFIDVTEAFRVRKRY